eukprot:TRINITY_DN766_c0_g1_i12.p1 TRINITY_DN766_c0_g1~~TRINITY_DN766_c0_g1_i12.p1  ORF type:complete len:197 (+),score=25.05 TRINITY_DN766_c0_g1_i12:102-692(+)
MISYSYCLCIICVLFSSIEAQFDNSLLYLQVTILQVNEECTNTSPSTWTIELYAKELIQETVTDVIESGVLLDQTKVSYSIFSPIIEQLARQFASQNFKDCKSKMVKYQDLSLLLPWFMEWMKENQIEGDVLLYSEDVAVPFIWKALEDNPACFDPVYYGLLASAPNCTPDSALIEYRVQTLPRSKDKIKSNRVQG